MDETADGDMMARAVSTLGGRRENRARRLALNDPLILKFWGALGSDELTGFLQEAG